MDKTTSGPALDQVTVVIPTLNEERALGSCLQSVRDFPYIIVVDSGSTDKTEEIALRFGAEFVTFHWNGKFPKKRNWLLLNYTFKTPWVLFLDADEHMTPTFQTEIASRLYRTDTVGYWVQYTNHFQGGPLRFGIPQKKLAIFRLGAGLFERIDENSWSKLDMEVHEHPLLTGHVGTFSAKLLHFDWHGLHKLIARHNEYSSWEAKRVCSNGNLNRNKSTFRQRIKYGLAASLWLPALYFVADFVLFLGFMDGRRGLHHALFKAIYFYELVQKVQELKRSGTEH